ncbi:MAG: DNA polymerase III subunit delta' [Stappiaceae bacterium]
MAKAPKSDIIPDLDAMPGMPLPQEQQRLFGHGYAERTLLEAYRSRRMHHAWIIGGPKGIGKATLAFRFAKFAQTYPDRFSPECGSANDLSIQPSQEDTIGNIQAHTNILHLKRPWDKNAKRYKTELTVDEVRRTVPFFGTTSGGQGWRICIVDSADEMNKNAANALLKVLEEPPDRSIFLILSHAPGRILPTIRSRCRRLDVKPLTMEDLSAALQNLGLTKTHTSEDVEHAQILSGGSVRRAALLLENGGVDTARAFDALVGSLPNLDVRKLHVFAEKVSTRGADDLYDIFKDLLRDRIASNLRKDADAGRRARNLVSWADVWEKANKSITLADALNLDRKQVVLNAFRSMADSMAMMSTKD